MLRLLYLLALLITALPFIPGFAGLLAVAFSYLPTLGFVSPGLSAWWRLQPGRVSTHRSIFPWQWGLAVLFWLCYGRFLLSSDIGELRAGLSWRNGFPR